MLASAVVFLTKSRLISSCSSIQSPDKEQSQEQKDNQKQQTAPLKRSSKKSEIFVQNHLSGETFYLGFSIETRETVTWGSVTHHICEIEPTKTSERLRLKNDPVLWKLNGLSLDGIGHVSVMSQFKAINYRDFTISMLTIEEEIVVEINLKMEEKLSYDVNETPHSLYSSTLKQTFLSAELQRDIIIEDVKWTTTFFSQSPCTISGPNIKVTHPKEVDICHIEHLKSQMYLQIENGRLVMKPLTSLDKISSMIRSMFSGSCECNGVGKVVVFTFRENVPHQKTYILATSEDTVGIQKYGVIIHDNTKILQASDPRLFVHAAIDGTSVSVFRSTAFPDHYLAYCESEVCLKQVQPGDIYTDEDIQFVLRYT